MVELNSEPVPPVSVYESSSGLLVADAWMVIWIGSRVNTLTVSENVKCSCSRLRSRLASISWGDLSSGMYRDACSSPSTAELPLVSAMEPLLTDTYVLLASVAKYMFSVSISTSD